MKIFVLESGRVRLFYHAQAELSLGKEEKGHLFGMGCGTGWDGTFVFFMVFL